MSIEEVRLVSSQLDSWRICLEGVSIPAVARGFQAGAVGREDCAPGAVST